MLAGQGELPAIGPIWTEKPHSEHKQRDPFAYRALLVFSILYYARPEDVIPGVAFIPVGKIAGGIALVALVASLGTKKGRVKLPLEIKLLLVLLLQMCLTISFAYWRGGAFHTVVDKFSKAVIVGLLISMLVLSITQLRKLIYVQAAAVATMTVVSLLIHRGGGRLTGVLGGIFENPNELAINIALNFPFCAAFLLLARGPMKKGLWSFGLVGMLYGVMATYLRSGFLALAVGAAIALWEFGIRGRRLGLVFLSAVAAMTLLLIGPSHYLARLETIVTMKEDIDPNGKLMSGDSSEARRDLLKESLKVMTHNPVFGVGPGNFEVISGNWHVAHNTYTQLGAEAGVPALFLFLGILVLAYRNLSRTQKLLRHYPHDAELVILTGGLMASLGAYLVGAFFADTAYHLFPYYLVAYTSAMYRIASNSLSEKSGQTRASGLLESHQRTYGQGTKTEPAWTR